MIRTGITTRDYNPGILAAVLNRESRDCLHRNPEIFGFENCVLHNNIQSKNDTFAVNISKILAVPLELLRSPLFARFPGSGRLFFRLVGERPLDPDRGPE